ncbi:MAG: DUF4139 domain-containing protein [Deltaproteobacteria bacterium]|nr:DUF4139 domain-containing protein [Deltaproteobacteria bacterium]
MPVLLLHVVATLALAPGSAAPDVLPLRKLRLYETGVGYFERHGGVTPGDDLALPLPASHLDDALKSLVVLDASGDTRVQGIQFASAVSEGGARAMAGLPQGPEQPLAYVDVLLSLEGAPVEILHEAGRIRGRLIQVEGPFSPPPPPQGTPQASAPREPWHAVVVVGQDGAIERLRTDTITSIKPLESATRERLEVAAEAMSEHGARRNHPLDVRVSSTGQLGLGYIAEAPVWRTTYRVVLGAETKAQLQAWALVHNDTDEDWKGVQLELANGRPQSFLYPLAAPRYAWRELEGPEEDLSTVPQLARSTPDRMWGDGVGGLGLVGTGRGGGGYGEGTIGLGNVGTIGHGGGGATGGPIVGDLAALSQAEGQQSGSLFIYRVADPVKLPAHHSALVPIVQTAIETESITWISAGGAALTGARVVNSTAKTLPAGVVSFFGDGGFIGETALRRLKPKERQFVTFGTEQDVELTRRRENVGARTVDVKFHDDELAVQLVREQRLTLDLTNRSGRARQVYVNLDVDRNANVTGDADLDYDLDNQVALAIVPVPAGEQVLRTLTVERPGQQRVPLYDHETLTQLAANPGLTSDQRTRIAAALRHRKAMGAAMTKVVRLEGEFHRQRAELDRLRRDLAAMGKARMHGRVAKRLARDLLEAEHRIERIKDQLELTREQVKRSERSATLELRKL